MAEAKASQADLEQLLKQSQASQSPPEKSEKSPLETTVNEEYKPVAASQKLWDLARLAPFAIASYMYAGVAPLLMATSFVIGNIIDKEQKKEKVTWDQTYREIVKGFVWGPAAFKAYSYVDVINNSTFLGKLKKTLFFNPCILAAYILPFNIYTYVTEKLGIGGALKGLFTGKTYKAVYDQYKNDEIKWGSTTWEAFKTFFPIHTSTQFWGGTLKLDPAILLHDFSLPTQSLENNPDECVVPEVHYIQWNLLSR